MRKSLITPIPQDAPPLDEGWLDLDGAAVVEGSRSHRKKKNIRWRLRWSQEKCGAGVPPIPALKPSG